MRNLDVDFFCMYVEDVEIFVDLEIRLLLFIKFVIVFFRRYLMREFNKNFFYLEVIYFNKN